MDFRTAIFLFTCVAYVASHNITLIEVPELVDPREKAEMKCRYRMGKDELHSVKWYRDEREIFRYTPGDEQQKIRTFETSSLRNISGYCAQSTCKLTLTFPMGMYCRNSFTCEVSTEGPRFAVARQSRTMTVAVLPQSGPKITGLPKYLLPNQEALLNCTSPKSLPATSLAWYIDGLPEQPDPLQYLPSKTEVSTADLQALRESWRTLRLKAKSGIVAHHVRCEATISLVPEFSQSAQAMIPVTTQTHISKFTAGGKVLLPSICLIITSLVSFLLTANQFIKY